MPNEITQADMKKFPELHICIAYLMHRDEGVRMETIARRLNEEFNTSWSTRAHLYNKLAQWRSNGTLAEAERRFLEPKIAEMNAAIIRAVNKWPEMLDKIIDVVLTGKSDKNRLDAFIHLTESIIKPAVSERMAKPSYTEDSYLELRGPADPLEALDQHLPIAKWTDDLDAR